MRRRDAGESPGREAAGGQLALKLEGPGREKTVSRRSGSRCQLAKSSPKVQMDQVVGELVLRLLVPTGLCLYALPAHLICWVQALKGTAKGLTHVLGLYLGNSYLFPF